ncbi:sugar phosphate isomerase/epimerase [Nonomuraea sp. KC401]|uniref:sugar phosphate isomerase/epimerase family protein n=1 Tax=unclassified Nonomuraea TaxID=2593643 RepID=UPI0010FF5ED6|nr:MULTISPECIES: sugar phosphate isomerase/epimerase [unclassified Nonomuraea]NBE96775.1 TIM barrel protein [Nonomuraea sp. K271]TLF67903.1 sugar phosphate isomerase/epimerase [Nonomuraea sp. KC401]
MTKPISVQLYTVREPLTADRDDVLRRISEIGYTAVEPYDPTSDPKGFRQVADDLGLSVSSTHAGALLRQEPAEVFDAVATLGTDLVIVPAGIAHEEFTTADGVARAADLLNGLAEQAAGHGMRIGYHNHWWELEPKIDGRHAIEVLADRLAPEVFLEIDAYWAAVGGADVPALLGRLGERVIALHVKDGPVVKGEPHTAVGRGVMPVPEILAAAPDAWRVVELDECATDIFAALADSHAYLTSLESL